MQRATFQQGMAYLAAAYGTELSKERAAVYWDQLGGLRDEPFMAAVRVAVNHGERFPTVGLSRDADTDPEAGTVIAELPDMLCRFLTAGDPDGDGRKEIVAAAHKSGLWLLEQGEPGALWSKESIDTDTGGFEHASILTDLDGDGTEELYVASDKHGEIRRYVWKDGKPVREVIHSHGEDFDGFTWNLMPIPVELIP